MFQQHLRYEVDRWINVNKISIFAHSLLLLKAHRKMGPKAYVWTWNSNYYGATNKVGHEDFQNIQMIFLLLCLYSWQRRYEYNGPFTELYLYRTTSVGGLEWPYRITCQRNCHSKWDVRPYLGKYTVDTLTKVKLSSSAWKIAVTGISHFSLTHTLFMLPPPPPSSLHQWNFPLWSEVWIQVFLSIISF